MRVAVLGAGSLGSVIGGCLARGGVDVWLVSRRPEYITAVSAQGLRLVEEDGTSVVYPHVTDDPCDIGLVDLVIVLVKAFDAAAALSSAEPLIGTTTAVLSMQNGLGGEELVADVVGRQRVLAGRTYVAGDALAPGVVRAGISGRATVIGDPFGGDVGRAEAVAEVLRRGGLDVEVSAEIRTVIWRKLLINVATGALAGVTGLPYGLLYRLDGVHRAAVAAVEEAATVARACGIDLGAVDAEAIWQEARRGLPDSFRTSILQSLDRGSLTEVGFINGAVVRHGRATGVPTPVNATLQACVEGLELARSGSTGIAGPGGGR